MEELDRYAEPGTSAVLRLLLIRFPFNLLHDVLKVGPFCRCDDLKLKAELPLSAPPDNRCLNLNGRFVLGDLDSNLESGSWLHIDGTFDATTPVRRDPRGSPLHRP